MGPRATLVAVLLLIVAMGAVAYVLVGPVATGVFAVFFLGGLVAWRMTTYGRPAEPAPIVVPYLLAVILFIVHVLDEYLKEFWLALEGISGRPIPEEQFMVVAAFLGPVIWLAGLTLLFRRTEVGNYLVWAFVVAMTVSELAHFVFPLFEPGPYGYFPGMYTALLPLIPAWVVAYRLVRSSKDS